MTGVQTCALPISYQFGGERMIKARRGVLERQSLEDNCLSADGEELSNACKSSFKFLIMPHC